MFISPERNQLLGLYVDDIVVLGQGLQAVQTTIDTVGQIWEIKDLGDIQVILGIQVLRDRLKRTLTLDQSTYIQSLIEKYRLQEVTPVVLLINDRQVLTKGALREALCDQALYQSLIEGIGWVSRGTRFDILYVLNQLSRHCSEPTVRHWNALIRVLRYLKGTKSYRLTYGLQSVYSPKL